MIPRVTQSALAAHRITSEGQHPTGGTYTEQGSSEDEGVAEMEHLNTIPCSLPPLRRRVDGKESSFSLLLALTALICYQQVIN